MPSGERDEKPREEAVVKIACVQMEPVIGERDKNVRKSLDRVGEAAAAGARLIVLPELCNSGYVLGSRSEAFALAEAVPGGPTCRAWIDLAHRLDLYLVAGICERDGAQLYNAAVVIGPAGHIGTFRKVHLWNEEALYFEPGNLGFPVFRTPIGRIGTFICYDGWFPESYRLCALQGADIVCIPTNWVPIPGQPEHREAMANVLCMAAAHSNSMFVAAADRVGVERGQPFIGQSIIVSYTGWPIGGHHLRRGQPGGCAAQAELERVQPGAARSTHRRVRRDARRPPEPRLVLRRTPIMSLPPLGPVAALAGHPLPEADLAQVASILDGIMEDIQKLRDLDLPDEVEPVLAFRVEPWD
jgi:predicted amidohydrolase